MRITFVLPDFQSAPVGGLKVAYELANGLAERGHGVNVLHVNSLRVASAARLRREVRFALWRRGLGGWFRLGAGVKTALINSQRLDQLPASDHIVAVGWTTVSLVINAPVTAGRRSYLAQGYMAQYGSPELVDDAWRQPIHKIVTSGWLVAKAKELSGEDVSVSRIHLAVGPEFEPTLDPQARSSTAVATYYHPSPLKGFAEAVAALSEVAANQPIKVVAFGAQRPDVTLPSWMAFERRPRDIARIYNSAATFVHTSSIEGFGLPPAEAMASGCVVAAFANDGVMDFAVDERNALLVPVGDVAGLSASVTRLIDDRELRLRLARQGVVDMSTRSWKRSIDEFEVALSEVS